jgi:hypothetical protein
MLIREVTRADSSSANQRALQDSAAKRLAADAVNAARVGAVTAAAEERSATVASTDAKPVETSIVPAETTVRAETMLKK